MCEQAAQIRHDLLAASENFCRATAASLSAKLTREVSSDEAADVVAQAIICAAPIIAASPSYFSKARPWLTQQLADWERFVLERGEALAPECFVPSNDSPAHWYDQFLHQHARGARKRAGVFFTPQPIADYIVRQADSLLRAECGAAGGLAGGKAVVLDPACGTGVFLLTVIDYLHRRVKATENRTASERWNDLIARLLPRLVGVEILPAAAFLAKLNVALKLAETGCDFSLGGGIRILIADALAADTQSKIQNPQSKIAVVLGNPPFSSLSTTTNDWIARLVRGDDEIRGYVRANGQSLGERKTWLHDDYVKFIRLAQWHIENAGAGIIGFVTNHGYLDNATFRLMRHELLRVFPWIEIVDLHGNRKKHEVAPDGQGDKNVFGLDQGVAIGLFCRPPKIRARSASEGYDAATVNYSETWGSRAAKLSVLQASDPSLPLRACTLSPRAPDWRFVPTKISRRHPEYDAAWSLADAMPLNATAPVTARDHFVVAFTQEELHALVEQFRDLSISDDEIRTRFFHRTRSARYPLGDSRGWKLAEARHVVAADNQWQEKIVRCLYRPFDWRYVFWHPAMIDWPRTELTRHWVENGQRDGVTERQREEGSHVESETLCPSVSPSLRLALIARRQQLPTQPCSFFWITDCLALDGVIRSDNRGSESLFPLYVRDASGSGDDSWKANFAEAFIDQFRKTTGLQWLPLGRGDMATRFGPEDVLAYIYALFHCPTYRECYGEELRVAFPRIIQPADAPSFERMCRWGRELIALHLLKANAAAATPHPALDIPHLPDRVAAFRAGGYVALHKWLQPSHRSTNDPQYERIAAAIARTIEIMDEIDRHSTSDH